MHQPVHARHFLAFHLSNGLHQRVVNHLPARRFADTGVPGTVLEDNDIAGEVSTVRATNIHQHAVMPCHRNDLHIRDNR
ncbi:hypothetical protein SRABI106_01606 [Rahnella aquatilis]|nr:hypothetical protein SRABI106_01606 [Rahnella aquatilis]